MYQIASCSKFITAIVVAKLYELGKLDYDTDINKYLKKWKCPKKGITLKHLLTHTSGSSDGNGYLGYPPQDPQQQDLDLNIKIINGKLVSKPFNITEKKGSKFMYSGAGFQVIQQVLEEITNERLYSLIERFNGNYRREVLSAHLFTDLDQVREQAQRWMWDYNHIRPHQSLDNLPPVKFSQQRSYPCPPSLNIDLELLEETIFTNASG